MQWRQTTNYPYGMTSCWMLDRIPAGAITYEHLYHHYNDVIMGAIASQITSLAIVYSTIFQAEIKHQASKKTSKLRVTGLYAGNSPGPVNSPHKWPVTRIMFPFDDVIMISGYVIVWFPVCDWAAFLLQQWNILLCCNIYLSIRFQISRNYGALYLFELIYIFTKIALVHWGSIVDNCCFGIL